MAARLDPGMVPGPACAKCGGERHYTGTRWRCSRCFNAWQTDWKSKRTQDQKVAATAVQTAHRREWSPEQRAVQNARAQAWREANRERHRRVTREWYQANAEHARAAKLAEYQAKPEAFYARNLVRKARLLNAVCEHGSGCVDAAFLADVYSAECVYCGAPAEHADHFVPLARGGLHCRVNILPACADCNASKSARDPLEWLGARLTG